MNNNKFFHSLMILSVLFLAAAGPLPGKEQPSGYPLDESLYQAMKWRNIGPFRGGRVTAVTGIPSQPYTYYFGACGGGVWKTEDGGISWKNISDGYFKTGSVGAVAVSEWDPNIIYAGMGEAPIRGNVSHGDGVYKSMDAGKTWQHMGLEQTYQISRIRIHPRNPDLVYAAALGHVYGPNEERGIYRSRDGGRTWEKVLYRNEKAGAIDLAMDPNNPRILYAAIWEAYRTPYSLTSGGPGSGLFKTMDGGNTWTEISRNPGLPKGILGKIGVAASAARSGRVWAIVEAEDGGVFRSDDGGENWARLNKERKLRQRAWYYSRIYADPENPEAVYVLNTGMYRSTDGGRTFNYIRVPHGDNHDLWIAPDDNQRMINSNDGGANVSYNGGESWTRQDNQPTAQFYHVITDNQFPYWVYGAQQDNSTVRIASRTPGSGIGREHWHSVGGGESGHIAPRHDDPDIVYAGSYGGLITRWDYETRSTRIVSPWPENPMGWGAGDLKYRFQWTAPILVSKFDSDVLYHCAQVVFKSTNEGQSWQVISPDLTTNDKSKQKQSGGPITKDDTSVEYYCTIFALAESQFNPDILWAGSDDGLVHITRNGGKSWQNITPKKMPEWSMISMIDTSTFAPGRAYIAVDRHRLDDFKPYIYKTEDFGKTWTKITQGIPDGAFVRVVREDPERKGLLYAGTETGIYVSFDDGRHWQSLQLNLPVVPIRDMVVKEDDLVAATHGRSFWILDDLTPLHQLEPETAELNFFLFKPRYAYRMKGRGYPRENTGQNPPSGSVIYYYLKEKPEQPVTMELRDDKSRVIKTFTSAKSEGREQLPVETGMNRFVWDMRYPDAERVPEAVLWGGSGRGPVAPPGKYEVRLTVGKDTQIRSWEWRKDPRINATLGDLQRQFEFLIRIRDRFTEVNKGIITLRSLRDQILEVMEKSRDRKNTDKLRRLGGKLVEKLTAIEDVLIQSKSESPQDPLNYPIKLDNKLAALMSVVAASDARPTQQSYDVFKELSSKAETQLGLLDLLKKRDISEFNELVKKAEIPAVVMK